MKVLQVLIFSLSVMCLIRFGEACEGYNLIVNYFKTCSNKSIIQISDDFQPVLHSDCSISVNGFTNVTKTITSGQIKYSIVKNRKLTFDGKRDLCHMIRTERNNVIPILEAIGFPKSCPLRQGVFSGNNYRGYIKHGRIVVPALSGKTVGKIEVISKAGDSCFELSVDLKKMKNKRF